MLPQYTVETAAPATPLKVGSAGFDVRRVQEWLGLRNHGVVIDGDFGPATDHALKELISLGYHGVVDVPIWTMLAAPLIAAAGYRPTSTDFGRAVVEVATKHLDQYPVEVGGDNCGPWVRHYCRGQQVAWCQGFASSIWLQAAEALVVNTPYNLDLEGGQWCLFVPTMVDEARRAGCFQSGSDDKPVAPGSMFFLRGGQYGYSHVGIVIADTNGVIETIEGNTSDNGSPNGYEVCRRFRKKVSCDFGLAAAPSAGQSGATNSAQS